VCKSEEVIYKYTAMFILLVRLQQEVNEVLGDDVAITEKVLDELHYTEQVCH